MKSKVETRLLLTINCSGLILWVYDEVDISNSVQAGNALGGSSIDINIHTEGCFPFLFLFLSENIYFSLPVEALLLLPFPCCLFSIPCSCTLTCCKASGCARDPTPPKVAHSHISCLARSGRCASSPTSSPPPRESHRHIAEGQSSTCPGGSNSFSGAVSCCNDSQHSRGIQAQLSCKERAHFPLLWAEDSRLCRKPLPQVSTDLVNGA